MIWILSSALSVTLLVAMLCVLFPDVLRPFLGTIFDNDYLWK
jgi:hypothetical protein